MKKSNNRLFYYILSTHPLPKEWTHNISIDFGLNAETLLPSIPTRSSHWLTHKRKAQARKPRLFLTDDTNISNGGKSNFLEQAEKIFFCLKKYFGYHHANSRGNRLH